MITKTEPIADRKLWDSLGNYCRVTLYFYGEGMFELYLHDFNDATPRRFIDRLGALNNRADLWLSSKKAAGFVEQLPSYQPTHHWHA